MEAVQKYAVKEIIWPGKIFITKRAVKKISELDQFFTDSFYTIFQAIKNSGTETTEPPCAIYYSFNREKQETDLAAAVPVNEPIKEMANLTQEIIPKSKGLLVSYYGSYENIGPGYNMLEKYISDHKLHKNWMLEEYFSDPAVEKDPAQWKTNIYFMVS